MGCVGVCVCVWGGVPLCGSESLFSLTLKFRCLPSAEITLTAILSGHVDTCCALLGWQETHVLLDFSKCTDTLCNKQVVTR